MLSLFSTTLEGGAIFLIINFNTCKDSGMIFTNNCIIHLCCCRVRDEPVNTCMDSLQIKRFRPCEQSFEGSASFICG